MSIVTQVKKCIHFRANERERGQNTLACLSPRAPVRERACAFPLFPSWPAGLGSVLSPGVLRNFCVYVILSLSLPFLPRILSGPPRDRGPPPLRRDRNNYRRCGRRRQWLPKTKVDWFQIIPRARQDRDVTLHAPRASPSDWVRSFQFHAHRFLRNQPPSNLHLVPTTTSIALRVQVWHLRIVTCL